MKLTLTKVVKTKKVKLKPVLVTWKDAHAVHNGWGSLDSLEEEFCIVHSIGWLIPEAKKDHVVLVLSVGNTSEDYSAEHVDSGIAIPTEMVIKIVDLIEADDE